MPIINLTQELGRRTRHEDGELIFYLHNTTWILYILGGQPIYATDRNYPVRRWDRALKQHGSAWNWATEATTLLSDPLWECQLINRGISEGKLSLIRVKLMLRSIIQECIFELSSSSSSKGEWRPGLDAEMDACKLIGLSVWELQTVSNRVERLVQQWQASGLGDLNPNFAPLLVREVETALPIPSQYLNGRFTLWDIAWQVGKTIVEVGNDLRPWVEKNILQFQSVSDLSLPSMKQVPRLKLGAPSRELTSPVIHSNATPLPATQGLIACIDDSPVLAYHLNKILVGAGYKTLNIQEPMRGFTQLIEHKPDLILLDLQLPNADGYSICKFLRDTPVFEKIPIIILTAHNTVVDRVRAKQAGATEFLGKPPQPEELLHLIHKYLKQ